MEVPGLSIVRKNGDGKLKVDWGALITLLVSLLISGVVTGFGSYYAIRYDIRQQDYRLTLQEHKTDAMDLTINALRLKDATDTESFRNACEVLSDIKAQLKEIRNDQIRRQRGGGN